MSEAVLDIDQVIHSYEMSGEATANIIRIGLSALGLALTIGTVGVNSPTATQVFSICLFVELLVGIGLMFYLTYLIQQDLWVGWLKYATITCDHVLFSCMALGSVYNHSGLLEYFLAFLPMVVFFNILAGFRLSWWACAYSVLLTLLINLSLLWGGVWWGLLDAKYQSSAWGTASLNPIETTATTILFASTGILAGFLASFGRSLAQSTARESLRRARLEAERDQLLLERKLEEERDRADQLVRAIRELAPDIQIGRYTVLRQLGAGGLAKVYLCRHNELRTLHAIKILHNSHPEVLDRLIREGRAQSTLTHPNIVAVTDTVEVDGFVGLVMEYVEGGTLESLLHEGLSLDQIDLLVTQILAAVAQAHCSGFVHRDLKPANILIAQQEGEVQAKVADFGMVKLMYETSDLTIDEGLLMGTPAYMAPEQVDSPSTVDARADIFALGCILYEMTTGQRPFTGKSLWIVLQRIQRGVYAPLAEVRPDLPPRMTQAIEAALRPDLADRVASVDDLLDVWRGTTDSVDDAAEA